ncbi:hypothetical protein BD770DRAFT_398522 [Pilaira anomala]|nr:hypothetical protein BD770DRAFT_398522 [Pilaira anomala]
MKENKFVMGEEEEVTKSSPTTTHKRPIRHHVKRRSSGRVHVAKIAPMARANAHTDSEADLNEETNDRPVMRRSQSQRSLHRISFDRKGFSSVSTPKKKPTSPKAEQEVFTPTPTPPPPPSPPSTTTTTTTTSTTQPSLCNPASITHRVIAEPIEQTLNATANTLVLPKKSILYPIISSTTNNMQSTVVTDHKIKKPLLRSHFITEEDTLHPPIQMPTPRTNLSRTQQKLMLQRQQSQLQDESSPTHPRNMQKTQKELDLLNREYKCIKKFRDPMKESLIRSLDRLKKPHKQTAHPCYVPHLEQRQIAHRHHHLKSIAAAAAVQQQQQQLIVLNESLITSSSSSSPPAVVVDKGLLGMTTAFLDRVFN